MTGESLALVHLNLTVTDVDRSIEFYRRWFGFAGTPRAYPDGTVFVGNADGFDLALHPGSPPASPAPLIHFGFRSGAPDAVRHLREQLRSANVTVIEPYDTDSYVSFKCLDPDNYEIEVYWEPRQHRVSR